jgi:hypothetical protein
MEETDGVWVGVCVCVAAADAVDVWDAVCEGDRPRDSDAVAVCEVVGATVDEGDGTKHEVRTREPAAPAPPVGAPPTYVTELVSDVTFASM